jgi:hypothetical protein
LSKYNYKPKSKYVTRSGRTSARGAANDDGEDEVVPQRASTRLRGATASGPEVKKRPNYVEDNDEDDEE